MLAETVTGYIGQILDECELDGKAIKLLTELYNEALMEMRTDELEHLNNLLQEKHGEDITVKICSYEEDDGSTKYYHTSAKYGNSNSYNTPQEAYKAADAYLCSL
jgi:hypothetical protein